MSRFKSSNSLWILAAIFILMLLFAVFKSAKASECEYQEEWCLKYRGDVEYIDHDLIRIDCLFDKYTMC